MRIFKSLYLLGAFVAPILFISCSSSTKNENSEIHLKLSYEVDVVNKQCPVKLTPSVRLDSCVLLENNNMINYYTLIDSSAYLIDSLKLLERDVKHKVKTDPSMAQVRSYGITLRYKYFDLYKKEIYSFDIVPNDYN